MCSLPMEHYIINMSLYGALHCRGSQEGGVLARVSMCECAVCTSECVCESLLSDCLTKGCGRDGGKVFLDVGNVWNICPGCHCSGGRAVGEERRAVRVSAFPSGFCQLKSFWGGEDGGKRIRFHLYLNSMRKLWMEICNGYQAAEHDETCNTWNLY